MNQEMDTEMTLLNIQHDNSHVCDNTAQNLPGKDALKTLTDLKHSMGVTLLNKSESCTEYCSNKFQDFKSSNKFSKMCLFTGILNKFPFIGQLRTYKLKKYFILDLIAGLTIGIMHIPQGMGFALLAGLPPVYGLYTSFFPVIVYFFFTSSRSTSFGSQSLVCLMLGPVLERECQNVGLCSVETEGGILLNGNNTALQNNITTSPIIQKLTHLAENHTSEAYVNISHAINGSVTTEIILSESMQFKLGVAILLAFIIGIVQMLLSVLQLGVISIYFSETFISACNAGAAFQIATTQIKYMLGLPLPPISGRFKLIKTWISVFKHITMVNIADLIVSAACLTVLILVKKLVNENQKLKRFLKMPVPIEILVVIVSTAISKLADLEQKFNINVVGTIPQGIPKMALPPVNNIKPQYILDAIPIALIGFLSAVLMAKLFANKYDYHVDINQELFANGISNTFSSFFSCFPSSVAPPRTMLFDSVGGKTQVAFLFSSVLVLLVLLVIGHLFQTLPTAVLACIIVVALIPLFERLADGKYLWKVNKLDCFVWTGTLLSVIVLDLGPGIVIGVLLSILSVVLHTQHPRFFQLFASQENDLYLSCEIADKLYESKRIKLHVTTKVKIFKFECPLYYANADTFSQKVFQSLETVCKEQNSGNKVNLDNVNCLENQTDGSFKNLGIVLILDFSCVHYMDIVGLRVLKTVHGKLKSRGVKMVLTACNLEVLKTMERFGLLDIIGDDHIYFSINDALSEFSME